MGFCRSRMAVVQTGSVPGGTANVVLRFSRRSSGKLACSFSLSVIWLLRCCDASVGVRRTETLSRTNEKPD